MRVRFASNKEIHIIENQRTAFCILCVLKFRYEILYVSGDSFHDMASITQHQIRMEEQKTGVVASVVYLRLSYSLS